MFQRRTVRVCIGVTLCGGAAVVCGLAAAGLFVGGETPFGAIAATVSGLFVIAAVQLVDTLR